MSDFECHPTNPGSPHPHCPTCGECAPFGDPRNQWLDWHYGIIHRVWWWLKRRLSW